jgi:hypothetical protein
VFVVWVEAGCSVVNGGVVKLVIVLVSFTPSVAEIDMKVIYTHRLARNTQKIGVKLALRCLSVCVKNYVLVHLR